MILIFLIAKVHPQSRATKHNTSSNTAGAIQIISDFFILLPDSGANEQSMTRAQQQKRAPGRSERRLFLLLSPSHALRVCSQSPKSSHANTSDTHIQSREASMAHAVGCGALLCLSSSPPSSPIKTAHSQRVA